MQRRFLRTLSEEPPARSRWVPEGRRHGRASYAGFTSRPEVPAVTAQPQSLPPTLNGAQRDVTVKVMLLGDTGVGKTCMMIKFKDGHFLSGTYISTVGIDYRNKVVEVDGAKVKLQVWDTAGQERFRSVTHAYYRDAHALLLLYDVTNKTSFENTRAWLAEIREYAQDNVVIMLLGNKCDRSEDRVVQSDDGERLAREFNVVFMETSAKTGMNVELAFSAIARDLLHRRLYPNGGTFNVKQFVEARSEHSPACACAT
ncbi:ras-related protein Rab-37-like isoform X2 [Amphibalanus amphitrite]|uniref:ras-related protein Rab-37-like isoform X2 n=1 Tax=Amphibalanus amphitrite TaxID=1232801 RepID=UPI001C903CCC|nr:ras-related protein Rab-37-like isoform X2 [Amphibalanus amphitrite]